MISKRTKLDFISKKKQNYMEYMIQESDGIIFFK